MAERILPSANRSDRRPAADRLIPGLPTPEPVRAPEPPAPDAELSDVIVPLPAMVERLGNLRIFVSVVDAGSVARAAEQLYKAPSGVTRAIIELEEAIGVPLFERKPRGMLPNAFGETVLIRARRIQTELRDAALAITGLAAAGPHGISLGAATLLVFSGRKLELIVLLATLRNVAAAAAQLGMTQAGASMALARIEAALDYPLFLRLSRGMVPTEITERLVTHAHRVFAELRHMAADVAAVQGRLVGLVVVGTTPLGRIPIFTRAVAKLCARHPGLRVSTIESTYEQLVRGLRTGGIDFVLGVLRPPELCHGLSTEPLFDDRMALLVRSSHRLAGRETLDLGDLEDESWVLPRPHALGRPLIDGAFRALGREPPDATVQTGDLAIIRQLLETSDFIAVTSPFQLIPEIRSGSVIELPLPLPEVGRAVGLTMRDGAIPSPAARALLEAIRHEVAEEHGNAAAPAVD